MSSIKRQCGVHKNWNLRGFFSLPFNGNENDLSIILSPAWSKIFINKQISGFFADILNFGVDRAQKKKRMVQKTKNLH